MRTPTLPPASRKPEEWIAWMADEPCLIDAIDTAVKAGMVDGIFSWTVGKWTAENRQDELAARIQAAFGNRLVKA